MKNLFLVLVMLVGSFSFASNGLINPKNPIVTSEKGSAVVPVKVENTKSEAIVYPSHTCTYRMYNADGKYLGIWSVYDVPADMDCGLPAVKQIAIFSYNDAH